MKKIVPDPPHSLDLPLDRTFSRAISDNLVPKEYVLLNISNYLMFAYSDSRQALERIEDEETRQLLLHGLRAIQIAWGQSEALGAAMERTAPGQ
ncbi:hypothetical protein ACIPW4_15225 [Pseudomonas sp. NPDC089996]|uniref:hypothetical protein n=1 Tax=Pseudomonas sp. NPDC089996 TaxID=3364474 RepID=UPI00381B56DC